jgi:flagellar assembly protein FliH
MAGPWPLESFDPPPEPFAPASEPAATAPGLSETALEEERLAAFDKGYKAGWDDAAAAHEEEQGRIDAELAANLQQMSFTYHEARGAVLAEMAPLLRGLVEKVLPPLREGALAEMVLARIEEAAEELAGATAEIVVAPDNRPRVEALVEGKVGPPVAVVEEPSLGPGQAYLRLGRAESQIDLDRVLAEIAAAVEDFFHPAESAAEERRHG